MKIRRSMGLGSHAYTEGGRGGGAPMGDTVEGGWGLPQRNARGRIGYVALCTRSLSNDLCSVHQRLVLLPRSSKAPAMILTLELIV